MGFLRKLLKELSHHSINDPTLLKQKSKRLHDEHLARTQQEYRDILRSQQIRQRKGQQFEGNEEYDYAVDPNTGWKFCKGTRGNLQTTLSGSRADLQAASSSSSTWDKTQWKTSNWNSQHSPSLDDWRKTSSQPTGGVNSTPTNTARTELHSIIIFHHGNTRGSRLRIAHLRVLETIAIHVSCLNPCRT